MNCHILDGFWKHLPDKYAHKFVGKLTYTSMKSIIDQVSLREKDFGIWIEYTWQDYLGYVQNLSFGMEELGVRSGDRVTVLSHNRPEWLYAELAAQSIGAVPTGIPPDALATEAQYIINHSEAKIVFMWIFSGKGR